MSNAITLYSFPLSGHAHRVRLFASLAGINHEVVDVDLAKGEQSGADFRAINPFGQVPAMRDGETVLADSNAILLYLARKYAPDWYSDDIETQAHIQRFLSVAAGPIAYGPAAARLVNVFGAGLDKTQAQSVAEWVFERLDAHLEGREWVATDRPSIADIALYSYTAHAPEGDVSLEAYPNIRAFLARIEALPGFVGMPNTPVGLAA